MPPEIMELLQKITENIWQIFYGLCLVGLGYYFKNQFQEIGKIVAKHDYKEKLEEIERSISKGKTDGEITAKHLKINILAEIEKSASKAKADGEITTQHLKRDLLADIKKSEANAKNSSEFEYHKRKEDSERLERFNLLLFEAYDHDNKSSANVTTPSLDLMANAYKKANEEVQKKANEEVQKNSNLKNDDILKLLEKHYPANNQERNSKAFEAKILYELYLKEYKNLKFNKSFNEWFEQSKKLKLENVKNRNLIIELFYSTCKFDYIYDINKETLEELSRNLSILSLKIDKESTIDELDMKFNYLVCIIESLSSDIRKTNK